MKIKLTEKKGFTLVELLIVLAIGGVILALAFSLQGFGIRSFRMGSSQAAIQQDARIIDELIKREIRNAMRIGETGFERTIELDNGVIYYGLNGENSFEVDAVESIVFEGQGERTLRYTVTGKGNGFQVVNEIFLNNTPLPENFSTSKLSYRLLGDGE